MYDLLSCKPISRKGERMKRTVKIADYGTQRDIKFCAEGNSAKLDRITTFLEYGGYYR